MELIIILAVVALLFRFIIKAGSFVIKVLAFGLLIIALWYFRYEIVDQLDQLSRAFSVNHWVSRFFRFIEDSWRNVSQWLSNLL